MFITFIKQDLVKVLVLFVSCCVLGLISNICSKSPLPFHYRSPADRLDAVVTKLMSSPVAFQAADNDVNITEISDRSSRKSAVILDARPEIFFRVGHIPSALSLPRDDFEVHYRALQATLASLPNKELIVYCSGGDCQDSLMVAGALQKLGYLHVRVFRGGWSAWKNAQLPQEKSE